MHGYDSESELVCNRSRNQEHTFLRALIISVQSRHGLSATIFFSQHVLVKLSV